MSEVGFRLSILLWGGPLSFLLLNLSPKELLLSITEIIMWLKYQKYSNSGFPSQPCLSSEPHPFFCRLYSSLLGFFFPQSFSIWPCSILQKMQIWQCNLCLKSSDAISSPTAKNEKSWAYQARTFTKRSLLSFLGLIFLLPHAYTISPCPTTRSSSD